MSKPNKQEKSLSRYDKFGIISSLIGLIADVLALSTFGFSLVNGTEQEPTIGIVLWLGILSIIPLIYAWGVLAWLANSKFNKMPISVILTGIVLSPLYIFWGAIVLAQSVPAYDYAVGYSRVNSESRAQGGLMAFALQLGVGLIILFVLMLWNKLIEQEPNNKTRL